MLKFQSFRVKDTAAVNKFLDTHVPYGTESQGGILLHEGYIVIKYDDGQKDDDRERVQLLQKKIDENKGKIISVEMEIRLTEIQIEDLAPKGYTEDTKEFDIKALYKADGHPSGEADNLTNQILHFRQANFISGKELIRLNKSIQVMQDMIDDTRDIPNE